MTVNDLLEKLREFGGDREVELECAQCDYCTTADDVEPKGRAFPNTIVIK